LFEDRGKPRKPVSRWPVAGPSGCIDYYPAVWQTKVKKNPLAYVVPNMCSVALLIIIQYNTIKYNTLPYNTIECNAI
jgi:hypothetical protein